MVKIMANIDPSLIKQTSSSLGDVHDLLCSSQYLTSFIETLADLSPNDTGIQLTIPATNGFFIITEYNIELLERAKKIIKKHLETDGTLREGKEVNQ